MILEFFLVVAAPACRTSPLTVNPPQSPPVAVGQSSDSCSNVQHSGRRNSSIYRPHDPCPVLVSFVLHRQFLSSYTSRTSTVDLEGVPPQSRVPPSSRSTVADRPDPKVRPPPRFSVTCCPDQPPSMSIGNPLKSSSLFVMILGLLNNENGTKESFKNCFLSNRNLGAISI